MNNLPNMDLRKLSADSRLLCLEMVYRAKASHIGSAFSCIDLISVLYGAVMDHHPADPCWMNRDRMILSKGHACVSVYSVLALTGYFSPDRLLDYATDGSEFMSHISHKVPGVEFSTGSLGHGLPFAVGKALGAIAREAKWHVFAILGDGELNEGSNWEAIMFAAHRGLSCVTAIVDCNGLQSLTTTQDTLSMDPLAAKFEAFGWNVFEVNGHDLDEIQHVLTQCKQGTGKPNVVLARTIKGKGVSFMEHSVKWHYSNPDAEEFAAACEQVRGAVA